MKKIIFTLLALSLLSCSDNSNDNSNVQDAYTGSITGKWKSIYAGFDDMVYVLDCDSEFTFDGNYYYDFKPDNTVAVYHNCDVEGLIDDEVPFTTGTYTVSESKINLNINGVEGIALLKTSIPENRIRIDFSGNSSGLFRGYDITVEKQ